MIETDFPAVTRPWLQYCKNHNCSVKFIKENPKEDLIQLKKDMLTSDFTPDHKHIRVSGLKSVKFKPETLTRI